MVQKVKVAKWLNSKYLEWVNQEGKLKNITDLAAYLEVNRNHLGRWLNGKSLPSNANVIRIANKFGPEIYDLLEWPRPN